MTTDYPQRKRLRLSDYDYSRAGGYFITVCTKDKQSLLGNIESGTSILSDWGKIAQQVWRALPETYPRVELDEFVVMPNHIHAILFLQDEPSNIAPSVSSSRGGLSEAQPDRASASLSEIIRHFKTTSAKAVNRARRTPGHPVWQRGFHEHVIRNEEDLFNTRQYIRQNPLKWELDRENPSQL
ncbi:MAG: transposase [bacterium]|nr:transposase [bacterium]